jgi:hypothetical protein
MTLRERSKQAGHADGSFSYLGFQVGPKTSSPRAAVEVTSIRADGYSTEPIRFNSWREAKEWIDDMAK